MLLFICFYGIGAINYIKSIDIFINKVYLIFVEPIPYKEGTYGLQ